MKACVGVLAAVLAVLSQQVSARPSNKSYTTLSILVVGPVSYWMDLLGAGVNMVACEINNRTDILPDATIDVTRIYTPPATNPYLATMYDISATYCGNLPQCAFVGPDLTASAVPFSYISPNAPAWSSGPAGSAMSDKRYFPLTWRYIAA
eukprot:jgi/Hompol1/3975/HPOL_006859-RA